MEACVFSTLQTLLERVAQIFLRPANRLLRAMFTFRCSLSRSHEQTNFFITNEPAERRRSAGEAAENSTARRMVYAKKFSIGIEKCKCKV